MIGALNRRYRLLQKVCTGTVSVHIGNHEDGADSVVAKGETVVDILVEVIPPESPDYIEQTRAMALIIPSLFLCETFPA